MFNPFDEKPITLSDTMMDWKRMYPKPYDKNTSDPYTKVRVILMNGIEAESIVFAHQFHRNCVNNDLRRELAMLRRSEQQQQKRIDWLSPTNETALEKTISYEQVAVDLTAWLAMHEPNPYVKATLDFILLEDFDHLYRYANLLDMDDNIPAHDIVKKYVEIMPGRPTISEHRHPVDTVMRPVDFKTADVRTKLNTLIIVSAEQQTMNYYMNTGALYYNDLGRQLYQEIAMIEEQHVTHYGSLLDPNATWLENLLMHQYMECFLYYSFAQDETDASIRSIWEQCLEQEITHLHTAAALLQKFENKHWQEVVPGPFPEPLHFRDTREYVRKILGEQVELTCVLEDLVNVNDLRDDHRFFWYQECINHDVNAVPSHVVIAEHQKKFGTDYRFENEPSPVESLRDRRTDNTDLGRKKTRVPQMV